MYAVISSDVRKVPVVVDAPTMTLAQCTANATGWALLAAEIRKVVKEAPTLRHVNIMLYETIK